MWTAAACPHPTPRLTSYVLGLLAIGALYFTTGEVALRLHEIGRVSALIWVPSGIGFAVVLLWGPQWWPGVALGTFATLAFRHHPLAALVATTTESLEVLLGYHLLRRIVRFRPQLDRVQDVIAFVVIDFGVAVIGATIGTAAVVAADVGHHHTFIAVWSNWWWVNVSGDLIVTPVMLTWFTRAPTPSRPKPLEVVALVIFGLAGSIAVLAGWLPEWLPGSHAPYYMLPIMLWAGVRFGPRGATMASLVASVTAIITDTLGIGIYPGRADLQAFVAISSVMSLTLSALAQERITAVARRGAIQVAALDGIVSIDEAGNVLELNPAAERLFGVREADVIGKDFATLAIPARLREAHHRGLRRYVDTGKSFIVGSRYRTTAWRATDGHEFPVEIAVTRAPIENQIVVTGFVRDVTAEYEAEAARREAHANLERKVEERTAELRESLRQGDLLLREIHHRVKNNLQVISSLLNLQVAAIRDESTRRVLVESQNRIAAMALVHQLLYRSKDVGRIDFGEYLRDLVERLVSAYNVTRGRIVTQVDAGPVQLDLDRAIPCGLIINELVSNALLHAFPGARRGAIKIALEQHESQLALSVVDDGVGLPENVRIEELPSFGLRIVRTLAQQLGGSITMTSDATGTTARVMFPAEPAMG